MELTGLLRELGYTAEWLAAGILDEESLRAQYAEYCASDDKHQEHYRAVAFLSFLRRTPHLTDDLVDQIFSLEDAGPDHCDLRNGRLIELIVRGILTDAQHFELARRYPQVLEPPVQARYLREGLLRKIRSGGLGATFAEIRECGDAAIQLVMLDHPDLTKPQVEWLATAGASKAIRNRAAELLRGQRFSRSTNETQPDSAS